MCLLMQKQEFLQLSEGEFPTSTNNSIFLRLALVSLTLSVGNLKKGNVLEAFWGTNSQGEKILEVQKRFLFTSLERLLYRALLRKKT